MPRHPNNNHCTIWARETIRQESTLPWLWCLWMKRAFEETIEQSCTWLLSVSVLILQVVVHLFSRESRRDSGRSMTLSFERNSHVQSTEHSSNEPNNSFLLFSSPAFLSLHLVTRYPLVHHLLHSRIDANIEDFRSPSSVTLGSNGSLS